MTIKSIEEFDILLNETYTPIVVKFTAPWCGPCQSLSPIVEQIKPEFVGRALFTEVNVDELPDLAKRYNIRSVPTMIAFVRGTSASQKTGLVSKEQLRSWLESNI